MEEYANIDDLEKKEENSLKSKFEKFLGSTWWWVAVVVLVAISAFCVGRFTAIRSEKEPVRVVQEKENLVSSIKNQEQDIEKNKTSVIKNTQPAAATIPQEEALGKIEVVASKNGTKYHLPTCAGAKQISDKNKITFTSIDEARAAGYTPAANCKGLK
ncbi:MAG TPA: hypothetical protein VJH67_03800 [Candidatus Paceibacterota bacterium]